MKCPRRSDVSTTGLRLCEIVIEPLSIPVLWVCSGGGLNEYHRDAADGRLRRPQMSEDIINTTDDVIFKFAVGD